ncbi:MAG: hypothetical protein JJU20_08750 [Opitutales bacterium]|nr:hypothetical protein [Opitutales bacterium]
MIKPTFYILLFLLIAGPLVHALELGSPFTSHMVLQRDKPVPVWGWAPAGAPVTVEFAGQRQIVFANEYGRWSLSLESLDTSAEGRSFKVSSGDDHVIQLDDVMVGEVWIASGQSNMDQTVARTPRRPWAGVDNEEEEIASGDHAMVRLFTAEPVHSYQPRECVEGRWQVASPETVGDFSAIGYFFGRDLSKELDVPVGVVVVSYGATTAHSWIRREAIDTVPELRSVLDQFDEQVKQWNPPGLDEWQSFELAYNEARAAGVRPPNRPNPHPVQNQRNPTVNFNGMFLAIVPYAARGFLWYQGESITSPRELFPRFNETLIRDWRKLWEEELPFLFCQLAGLRANSNSPQVRAWQAEALQLPNTGMAVTIDIGDEHDVHPKNKQAAADRLVRLALARAYGQDVPHTGPVFARADRLANEVNISFYGVSGRLAAPDGSLDWFELAGADGEFYRANAEIDGNKVRVSHPKVTEPSAIRYAWVNYPEGGGLLFDEAGLPAHPFQTDID